MNSERNFVALKVEDSGAQLVHDHFPNSLLELL